MSKADIPVSGATGRTGGAAIDELLKMGKRVRAYVRSDDDRSAVLRKRGVDIAVGDFTDIEGHEGKIYTLHGPVEMNHTEIAAAMSEVLGAKIEYAPTSIEEFKGKMEQLYKFPPFLVQHLVEVAQNYREGIFAGTNDIVEKITGTPALSVPAFIEKHWKAFA
jgi:uncharacterized protein YbjT (DUF2867 family)